MTTTPASTYEQGLICGKCGQPMPDLPDDLLRLARANPGVELGHDVCPGDATANAPAGRYFEVRTSIVEITQPNTDDPTFSAIDGTTQPQIEEMAAFRCGVTAPTFEKALRPLALALGEKWQAVERQAPIADGGAL